MEAVKASCLLQMLHGGIADCAFSMQGFDPCLSNL